MKVTWVNKKTKFVFKKEDYKGENNNKYQLIKTYTNKITNTYF